MAEDSNSEIKTYSEGLRHSFSPDVIRKIHAEYGSNLSSTIANNILDMAAGFIPVLDVIKSLASFKDYRNYRIAVKLLKFLEAFSREEYNPDELDGMIQEIDSKNKESFFESMMDIIERIDNINKTDILANILRHSIRGDISRSNYLRHCWIIANVTYIDLQQLYQYTVDYYEPSSTEILFANGLIRETVIDGGEYDADDVNTGGSKYGLSPLGEEMLRFGLNCMEWQYKGNGRTIPDKQWEGIS